MTKHIETITAALVAIQNDHAKLQASADVLGMKVMKVELCVSDGSLYPNLSGFSYSVKSARYYNWNEPTLTDCHAYAAKKVAEIRAANEKTHAENAEAIDNNKRIAAAVTDLMNNLGIGSTYSYRGLKTPRSKTTEWLRATSGWVTDLQRTCVTTDGFDACAAALERRMQAYDAELAKHQADTKRAEEAKRAELLKQTAVTEAIAYLTGEGLKAPGDYTIETAVEVARLRRQDDLGYLKENWQAVVNGYDKRFEMVSDTLEDTWRWGTVHHVTVKSKTTGRTFGAGYRRQPEMSLNDCQSEVDWTEVTP